jgi:hypothetical protein
MPQQSSSEHIVIPYVIGKVAETRRYLQKELEKLHATQDEKTAKEVLENLSVGLRMIVKENSAMPPEDVVRNAPPEVRERFRQIRTEYLNGVGQLLSSAHYDNGSFSKNVRETLAGLAKEVTELTTTPQVTEQK